VILPRLHLVTDDRVLARADFVEQARKLIACSGPAFAFHLRGPGTTARTLYDLGTVLRPDAAAAGVPFFVNDRLDLALMLGAAGVQLGHRSVSPVQARRLLGETPWIGASVHSPDEAAAAQAAGAGFVLLGAIHATRSHPGSAVLGLDALRDTARRVSIPVVAIGGITVARLSGILHYGAWGGAILSAVWDAPDPATALIACIEALAPATG
jgi:thiamine-phosphate diphosphorylase